MWSKCHSNLLGVDKLLLAENLLTNYEKTHYNTHLYIALAELGWTLQPLILSSSLHNGKYLALKFEL